MASPPRTRSSTPPPAPSPGVERVISSDEEREITLGDVNSPLVGVMRFAGVAANVPTIIKIHGEPDERHVVGQQEIPARGVSVRHFVLQVDDENGVWIEDVSRYGTSRNKDPLERAFLHQLAFNDVIRLTPQCAYTYCKINAEPETISGFGWIYAWRLPWTVVADGIEPLCLVKVGQTGTTTGSFANVPDSVMFRFAFFKTHYAKIGPKLRIPGDKGTYTGQMAAEREVMGAFDTYPDLGLLMPRNPQHKDVGVDDAEAFVRALCGTPLPSSIFHQAWKKLGRSAPPAGFGQTEFVVMSVARFNMLRAAFHQHWNAKQELSMKLRDVAGLWNDAHEISKPNTDITIKRPGRADVHVNLLVRVQALAP